MRMVLVFEFPQLRWRKKAKPKRVMANKGKVDLLQILSTANATIESSSEMIQSCSGHWNWGL